MRPALSLVLVHGNGLLSLLLLPLLLDGPLVRPSFLPLASLPSLLAPLDTITDSSDFMTCMSRLGGQDSLLLLFCSRAKRSEAEVEQGS